MALFGLGKKKQPQLTAEELRWNALWERWANGEAPSPLAEIMTYQSEVNNGGHDQFFFNVSNTGDLSAMLAALFGALPEHHAANLRRAHEAYQALEARGEDAQAEAVLAQCDAAFYEREEEINALLRACAADTTNGEAL